MRTARKISLSIRREKITSVTTAKNSKNKNVSVIIGDSIIKEIIYKMNKKIVVKFFGGAITKDMESYVQPKIQPAPSNVILQCGTNDLKHLLILHKLQKTSLTSQNR